MSFLAPITACNRHDLTGFRSFIIAGHPVGWIRHSLAERLTAIDPAFEVTETQVVLRPSPDNFEGRSRALARAADALVASGDVQKLHGEHYPVLARWGTAPLASLNRSVVAHFGITAYGLHVNGLVRQADGNLALWVARRAMDREVEPGKLDNLIAGGQPIGLGITENLVKEANEEAGFGPDIAARAVAVGTVTYRRETTVGLKNDVLFCYDLELATGQTPHNTDGEVESFELWPVDRVIHSLTHDLAAWKFNVPLVVIDFLLRHGFIKPDHPDYPAICAGLRQLPIQE